MTVEYVRPVHLIGIFEVVIENELTFVIDTDCSIHIVRQRQPMHSVIGRGEEVLRSVINHQEYFREDVIIEHRDLDKVTFEFSLELGKAVFFGVGCIAHTVDRYRRAERCVCSRISVGGNNPVGQDLQPCKVGIVLGITCLEIVEPISSRVVASFEDYAVARIVLDFPAFASFGKTEDLGRSLIVIEIVLAPKSRFTSLGVVPENNHWEAFDAPTNAVVIFLCRKRVRNRIVEQRNKLDVVCALARCHVSLHRKDVRRNGARAHLVRRGVDVGSRQHNTVGELDFEVLLLVSCGRCTLDVDLRVSRRKALCGICGIHKGNITGQLIALELRKSRRCDNHIRQSRGELLDNDFLVLVEDVVSGVCVDSVCERRSVVNVVHTKLISRQALIVEHNLEKVDTRAVSTNRDANGGVLLEVIVGRILNSTAHYAVHKNVDEAVERLRLNDERNANALVFLELHREFGLLGVDLRVLRSNSETSAARTARKHDAVVVSDVMSSHFYLDGYTVFSSVNIEQ